MDIRKHIISYLLLISCFANAQELSNIGKKPFLTLTGGISLNQIGYFTGDTLSRRNPYSYTFMASLNVSIYGWSIPLSLTYSNRQWSYQQPFNQFSLQPSYKWVKMYIGYSSMSFSQYTLSGHQFLGSGVELSPQGKFRVSAMAGRLQKRILPDNSGLSEPAYERMGTGLKVEYFDDKVTVGGTIFYAWDKGVLFSFVDTSKIVLPQENLVLGLNSGINLIKNVNLNIEYAISTLSENTFASISDNRYALLPFYKRRISSHQYNAIRANLDYNSLLGNIGIGLERVDPGYRTLGAYYNSNDFINYTINYGSTLLKNKISLAISYGFQKDDLQNQKSQQNIRNVGNININCNPIQTLNISVLYSNFYNYTNIRSTFENINTTSPYGYLDTLSFTQISETYGSSINYSFGNKEKIRQSLTFSSTYQKASQKQTDNPSHANNKFYVYMAGYNARFKNDLSTSLMLNFSYNIADSIRNSIIGPTLSINKAFFDKKLKTSAMISYNKSDMNKKLQGENIICRLSGGYVLKQQHNFNLAIINALRNNKKIGKRNECTINLTYSYNFSVNKKKDKNNEQKEE